jgi:hypothetical protein
VNDVPEYNVEGGIGACFAVDPVFSTYSYVTTPLRITAVVRGYGIGEPGFDLRYESNAPIASTDVNNLLQHSSGWLPVIGTDPQEMTWEVPDARFVGLYGYNFCFYTVSAEHAHFSIQRVTVSR